MPTFVGNSQQAGKNDNGDKQSVLKETPMWNRWLKLSALTPRDQLLTVLGEMAMRFDQQVVQIARDELDFEMCSLGKKGVLSGPAPLNPPAFVY
jgi:hypothetical protein